MTIHDDYEHAAPAPDKSDVNLVEALRIVASTHPNMAFRQTVWRAADSLAEAIEDFRFEPTAINLQRVNGAWSFATATAMAAKRKYFERNPAC